MLPVDKLSLLIVEDSDDDLFFFRRLLKKAGINNPLSIATDGQQAIAHLARALNPAEPVRPDVPRIVFLDLKLPLKTGFEVLEWIRTQPGLAQTIVVILSSSAETRDVVQAFRSGAQGYLVKYPEPAVFVDLLERVHALAPDADFSALVLPGLKRPALT